MRTKHLRRSRLDTGRSGTGMLLYLVKHSRPDISNGVRELTKCMDGATLAAYREMLRVIKYVLDTKQWGLKLEPTLPDGQLVWNLVVYTDSDWAGDKDNRKSVSGFIMYLCGVPIMWRSKQQQSVALSSSEAEYIAVSEAAKEIMFVLNVLESLNIEVQSPVTVRVDNMGAIFMTENNSSGGRTRHIDTRWHYVKDLVQGGVLEVIFVKSAENKSDGFTKNVSTEIYDDHRVSMVWDKSEVCSSVLEFSQAGRVLNSESRVAVTDLGLSIRDLVSASLDDVWDKPSASIAGSPVTPVQLAVGSVGPLTSPVGLAVEVEKILYPGSWY